MGRYKIALYFKLKIGISIEYDYEMGGLVFCLPFVDIYINWGDDCQGYLFFNKNIG